MGRSVYTPSETEVAIYASFDSEDEYEWNDAIDVLVEQLEAAYPSVGSDSGWIGREARVVASSRLARITVSEYCGCVAVCIVPEGANEALACRWARQVAPRFETIVASAFGNTMRRLGTFSNGEAVYQRA